jgi:AcrR family transcriptional regulator
VQGRAGRAGDQRAVDAAVPDEGVGRGRIGHHRDVERGRRQTGGRYFKSKNEIINAIAETVTGGMLVHLTELADRKLPLIDALTLVIDLVDDQVGPDGDFRLGLQVWAEASLDPAIGVIVNERYRGMRDVFVALAANAVAAGELAPATDVDAVGGVLFGLLPGYGLQRLLVGTPDKATYLAGVRALLAR